MTDKRVVENKDNVLNLKKFLIDICTHPKKYAGDEIVRKSLSNQKVLSKYQNDEFSIKESSLNTLKRTSEKLFENGFDEIDKLRELALEKLNENLNDYDAKPYLKSSIVKKSQNLEKELEHQKRVSMVCMSQLLETVQSLKNINKSNDLSVIHMISDDLLKRLLALSNNSVEFIELNAKNNNLKLVRESTNE